jgi:hypothetical protein
MKCSFVSARKTNKCDKEADVIYGPVGFCNDHTSSVQASIAKETFDSIPIVKRPIDELREREVQRARALRTEAPPRRDITPPLRRFTEARRPRDITPPMPSRPPQRTAPTREITPPRARPVQQRPAPTREITPPRARPSQAPQRAAPPREIEPPRVRPAQAQQRTAPTRETTPPRRDRQIATTPPKRKVVPTPESETSEYESEADSSSDSNSSEEMVITKNKYGNFTDERTMITFNSNKEVIGYEDAQTHQVKPLTPLHIKICERNKWKIK